MIRHLQTSSIASVHDARCLALLSVDEQFLGFEPFRTDAIGPVRTGARPGLSSLDICPIPAGVALQTLWKLRRSPQLPCIACLWASGTTKLVLVLRTEILVADIVVADIIVVAPSIVILFSVAVAVAVAVAVNAWPFTTALATATIVASLRPLGGVARRGSTDVPGVNICAASWHTCTPS